MPEVEELIEPTDIDTADGECALILFNDSVHEFETVIGQVMKATGFGYNKAEAITMEAHTRGRALVLEGTLEECLKAQCILEEIHLRTAIEVSA